MNSVLKWSGLAVVAVSLAVGGCASPTEEDDTGDQGGAATAGNDASNPLVGKETIKQWVVRDGASKSVGSLWVSNDGAFTVKLDSESTPWNGAYNVNASTLTLKVNNDGGQATATSPVGTQAQASTWTFAAAGEKITLTRTGGTALTLVLSAS